MALRIAVVLHVDEEPALAGLFGRVVLGMAHLPVRELLVLDPGLLRNGPALEHVARAKAERYAEFVLLKGDLGEYLE